MNESEIVRVVEVFEMSRAEWALVGAHAINLLTEPRATTDFNFIIETGKLNDVLDGLVAAFGDLAENDIGAAIQLKAIDVDLIRSTNHPLFRAALRDVRTIGEWKVPQTEVLVVLKFLSAVSPWRERTRRIQDIGDITAIQTRGKLDRAKMIELSKLVYPGAENEFCDLLDKIERGEPISI